MNLLAIRNPSYSSVVFFAHILSMDYDSHVPNFFALSVVVFDIVQPINYLLMVSVLQRSVKEMRVCK